MRIRHGFGVLAVVLCTSIAPAVTHAQDGSVSETEEQARAHFRLGRAHYDNGNFAQAAVEFEHAYRISQRAALLYNIYLAYRDANDTNNAAEALRKYLALEKNIENRGQLESRLAALDRSIKENPSPPTAAAPAPGAQPLAPAPSQTAAAAPETTPAPEASVAASAPPPAPKPFPVVPVALMGGGGLMVVGSVVTGLMASGKQGEWDDARDACEKANNCDRLTPARVAQLDDVKSSGQTLALVTDILLFGGLAVAGTGVVLFLLDQGSAGEKTPSTTAGLTCLPGQCAASVQGRF